VPNRYVVPPRVKGVVIVDAAEADGKAEPIEYVTRSTTEFLEAEVVIHPSGKVGRHGPSSQTLGGRYASEGKVGFRRANRVLIVPQSSVQVIAS
jgi:hypothetical protein